MITSVLPRKYPKILICADHTTPAMAQAGIDHRSALLFSNHAPVVRVGAKPLAMSVACV
jgi:hypothetical protein